MPLTSPSWHICNPFAEVLWALANQLGSFSLTLNRGLGMKGCWWSRYAAGQERAGWLMGGEKGKLVQTTHSRSTKVTEALLGMPDYTTGNGEPWKCFKQERSLSGKGRKWSRDAFKKSTFRCYTYGAQRRVWPPTQFFSFMLILGNPDSLSIHSFLPAIAQVGFCCLQWKNPN